VPQLEDQAIGRSDRGGIVVAELWSGFPAGRDDKPRWAVVLHTNGRFNRERSGAEAEIRKLYNKVAKALARHPLTEAQARQELAAAGLPAERFCVACHARLPMSGRFCVHCGQPHGNHVTVARPAPGSNAKPIVLVTRS
jgi:hypothetical protein